MKLSFDISAIPYGTGVSRYTSNVVRAMGQQLEDDQQLQLFGTSLRQQQSLGSFVSSVTCKQVSSRLLPIPPKAMHWLINQVNLPIEYLTGKIDVFHAWDWYIPRTKNARLITTIHDLALFKFPDTAHPDIRAHHQQALDRIERYADVVIAVSEASKQDIIELTNISPDTIHVIHEALPEESKIEVTLEDAVSTQEMFGINKPYFLIVGTQEPRKNIPRMIAAWNQDYADEFQLVLVGKSAWDKIPDHPGLIKTGYVEGRQLAALYAGAKVFLYCSLYEGFGLPILEAFYHQTPVVTSNVSSMPEVAGEAAVLVNPLDVTGIASSIQQALDKSSNLIVSGTKQLQQFSWEKAAKETLGVYKTL